jgi:hypothetical protein
MKNGLFVRLPLLFFHNFLAQFAFGGEGPAVDDAEGLFVLVVFVVLLVGQGRFPQY